MRLDLITRIQQLLEFWRQDQLSALTVPAFHGRPEQEPAMPYLVLNLATEGMPNYRTDRSYVQDIGVEFICYDNSDVVVQNILDVIEDGLTRDTTHLLLPNGESIACNKTGGSLAEDPDRDDDGQTVWQGILVLEFLVRRSE